MKELGKEIQGEFHCLRKNTGKCKTFSVPIAKEVERIYENGEKYKKHILQITIY